MYIITSRKRILLIPKHYILLATILILGISHNSFCQTLTKKDSVKLSSDVTIEQAPSFPGGDLKLYKFIEKNKKYPTAAKVKKIEGKIYVEFIVTEFGKIKDAKVTKESLGYGCDEEAIRLVTIMPNWIPGKQNGKAVAVRYRLPINFKL